MFYNALLLERILFDFRRGLPVFLNYLDGFFMIPSEFLENNPYISLPPSDLAIHISGQTDGTATLACQTDIHTQTWQLYADTLLSLVKKSELLPQITLYPCNDPKLQKCVTHLSLEDLAEFKKSTHHIQRIIKTNLPTTYHHDTQLVAYRVMPSLYEYYALIINNPDVSQSVNVRLHAECFTGDVLGSLRCDCQPQLHKALKDFSCKNNKGGVIIYMRQEGRNIGLLNKMRAYDLQNQGYDTVDANLKLGFKLDERDYDAAALILKDLNITQVNLLTNNPSKISALQQRYITVHSRVAHYTEPQAFNKNYIKTKQNRIGHLPDKS